MFTILRYDDPAVIVGQGTIGLEIIEDIPDVDVVVVPVGGGGLIAGVSLAMKTLNKNIKIIVQFNFIIALEIFFPIDYKMIDA